MRAAVKSEYRHCPDLCLAQRLLALDRNLIRLAAAGWVAGVVEVRVGVGLVAFILVRPQTTRSARHAGGSASDVVVLVMVKW